MSDESGRRDGYFWDMQTGRMPPSPARTLLGWKLLNADPALGVARAQFEAKPQFLNPMGMVQGGLLSAMLDNVMGAALAARLPPGQFVVTLELNASFIQPARPGQLIGEGRVIRQGQSVCFLEGHLEDLQGRLLTRASATVLIVSYQPPRPANASAEG